MLRSQIEAKEGNGEVQRGVYLPELRSVFSEMAGAVWRLRRMEHLTGRGFSRKSTQNVGIGHSLGGGCLHVIGRRGHSRTIPAVYRLRCALLSGGRGSGAGLRDPDRRRSRDREIDPDVAGGGGPAGIR